MAQSKNKTRENDVSVSNFIKNIEDPQRKKDCQTVHQMLKKITKTSAKMWGASIVGYGKYHYKYESGREGDFMKIGFAPRKTSLTLYIMPGFGRYDELMNRLGKYKTGKSCLYIKKLEDVDIKVLEELMKSSFDYMTEKYC